MRLARFSYFPKTVKSGDQLHLLRSIASPDGRAHDMTREQRDTCVCRVCLFITLLHHCALNRVPRKSLTRPAVDPAQQGTEGSGEHRRCIAAAYRAHTSLELGASSGLPALRAQDTASSSRRRRVVQLRQRAGG